MNWKAEKGGRKENGRSTTAAAALKFKKET
jgi:hypothetical protein